MLGEGTGSEYQRILIAGAGGGFDIVSGIPLYFALKALEKEVFLEKLEKTKTWVETMLIFLFVFFQKETCEKS